MGVFVVRDAASTSQAHARGHGHKYSASARFLQKAKNSHPATSSLFRDSWWENQRNNCPQWPPFHTRTIWRFPRVMQTPVSAKNLPKGGGTWPCPSVEGGASSKTPFSRMCTTSSTPPSGGFWAGGETPTWVWEVAGTTVVDTAIFWNVTDNWGRRTRPSPSRLTYQVIRWATSRYLFSSFRSILRITMGVIIYCDRKMCLNIIIS